MKPGSSCLDIGLDASAMSCEAFSGEPDDGIKDKSHEVLFLGSIVGEELLEGWGDGRGGLDDWGGRDV